MYVNWTCFTTETWCSRCCCINTNMNNEKKNAYRFRTKRWLSAILETHTKNTHSHTNYVGPLQPININCSLKQNRVGKGPNVKAVSAKWLKILSCCPNSQLANIKGNNGQLQYEYVHLYFIRHVLYIMITAFHALWQILPSGHYKLRSIATIDAFTSYFTGYLYLYFNCGSNMRIRSFIKRFFQKADSAATETIFPCIFAQCPLSCGVHLQWTLTVSDSALLGAM